MADWQEGTLSDVAEVLMGQSPPGESCNQTGEGIPLLNGPSEFTAAHPLAVQYTTDARKICEAEDLLFCVRGSTTGRMNWSDKAYAIGRGLAAIRHRKGAQYKHFLKGVIDYNLPNLLAAATGSTFPNVSRDQIMGMRVLLPPLPEQQAIAEVLSALDEKIELNRRMNATLEAMARALFRSWFVDFDPVRAKMEGRAPDGLSADIATMFPDTLIDSPLGEIPKGWEESDLSKLCLLNSESWTTRNHPEHVEYIDLANTKWGTIESTQQYSWSDAPSRAKRIVRPGDTIVGTVRPGNGSYAYINRESYTASTGFAALRPIKPQYAELIYLAVTAPENIERLSHLADGGAYPAVRSEIVLATPIVAANDKIFSAFSEIIKPSFNRIEKNKEENQTLSQLRDTLLPKLISGHLRVTDATSSIREAV